MTPQQIVALGVRLFAIFVALQNITSVLRISTSAEEAQLSNAVLYTTYGTGAFIMMVAALLWLFPMSVAHTIVPRTRFENHLKIQALDAARVGASLIGLWLLASALPDILWSIAAVVSRMGDGSFFDALMAQEKLNLLYQLAQLAISSALIFQSHQFAKLAMRSVDA